MWRTVKWKRYSSINWNIKSGCTKRNLGFHLTIYSIYLIHEPEKPWQLQHFLHTLLWEKLIQVWPPLKHNGKWQWYMQFWNPYTVALLILTPTNNKLQSYLYSNTGLVSIFRFHTWSWFSFWLKFNNAFSTYKSVRKMALLQLLTAIEIYATFQADCLPIRTCLWLWQEGCTVVVHEA